MSNLPRHLLPLLPRPVTAFGERAESVTAFVTAFARRAQPVTAFVTALGDRVAGWQGRHRSPRPGFCPRMGQMAAYWQVREHCKGLTNCLLPRYRFFVIIPFPHARPSRARFLRPDPTYHTARANLRSMVTPLWWESGNAVTRVTGEVQNG